MTIFATTLFANPAATLGGTLDFFGEATFGGPVFNHDTCLVEASIASTDSQSPANPTRESDEDRAILRRWETLTNPHGRRIVNISRWIHVPHVAPLLDKVGGLKGVLNAFNETSDSFPVPKSEFIELLFKTIQQNKLEEENTMRSFYTMKSHYEGGNYFRAFSHFLLLGFRILKRVPYMIQNNSL